MSAEVTSTRSHGGVILASLLALAAGGVALSYWAFFLRPEHRDEARIEPPPRPPFGASGGGTAAETRPDPVLTIDEFEGSVEVALPGESTFHVAARGERLRPQSRLRTSARATLTLKGNDGSTLKLLGGSNARVEQLGRDVRRLRLGGGMIEVEVPDDPTRLFQLDLNEQGDGAARTHGASFVAVASGEGRGAVATNRGELILSVTGKEVTIHTGEMAHLDTAGPSGVTAAPASLFLKVAWPRTTTREHSVPVTGQTTPFARVRVGDEVVSADQAGQYHANVHLPDGNHTIDVEARDLAGRRQTATSPRITVDSSTDFQVKRPKWK